MSDRINTITVVLDKETRDDDCERFLKVLEAAAPDSPNEKISGKEPRQNE